MELNDYKERQRAVCISARQKEVMIEFLKRNPKLISGRYSKDFTLSHGRLIWQELTKILNSIPGATNNWTKWRKCWHDLLTKIKKKRRLLILYEQGLMSGMPKPTDLTNLECEILQVTMKEDDRTLLQNNSNFIDMNGFETLQVDNQELIIIDNRASDYLCAEEDESNPLEEISSVGSPMQPDFKEVEVGKTEITCKKRRKKRRFMDSQTASNLNYLRRKLLIKKQYYNKKLKLMEKEITMKESMVKILTDISAKLGK